MERRASTVVPIFSDNKFTIHNISKSIEEHIWFRLSWKDDQNSSVSVSSRKDLVVFLVIWENENSQIGLMNSLQNEGWILKNDLDIWWQVIESWKMKKGPAKAILLKPLNAGHIVAFNKPEKHAPLSIFVIDGRIE